MNPRRFLPLLVVLALCAPGAARADDEDTILRRPEADVALGPTRAQGDFADHLDAILAVAGDTPAGDPGDSMATSVDSTVSPRRSRSIDRPMGASSRPARTHGSTGKREQPGRSAIRFS